MMRQSLGHTYRCRFWRLLQANKVAHGDNVFQVGESSGFRSRGMGVNVKVRQGSSTSSWDVGNPPTEEKHPGQAKAKPDEKNTPSGRPEKVETPSLEKEYSARDLFNDKAKETEERLSQEGKVPETKTTNK